MSQPYLLDRLTAAPAYLRDVWGVSYTRNTLNKLAHEGGGPRYVMVGNKAFYRQSDLDDWIEGKMRVRGSTSEPALVDAE